MPLGKEVRQESLSWVVATGMRFREWIKIAPPGDAGTPPLRKATRRRCPPGAAHREDSAQLLLCDDSRAVAVLQLGRRSKPVRRQ